jgi:sec-independent protein translocase protein TatA
VFGKLFDSPVQLLIILLIIVLLFGAKRLPDAARGLGRSLRILKSEVRDLKDDETSATPTARTEAVEGRVLPSEPTRPAPESTLDPRRDA